MTDGTGGLARAIADSPAAGRLKEAAGGYAVAQGRRLLAATGRRLGETSARIEDMDDADDAAVVGFVVKETVKGAVKDTVKGAVRDAVTGVARKATGGLAGRRRGGGGTGRTVTIGESVDVGAPLPDAYDRWALLHETDGPAPDWRPRILWSTRGWRTRITEEIEDERIVWSARGARGSARGVATFHEVADNLTRVLLVLEYRPRGLRRAGGLWAAPARHVRHDLENFRRSVMLRGGSAAGRAR
ncbi:hypothetical protein [Streptomyces macrosporus]|uniref:Cyclase n=1 Tax=Streptomyces macrosporus TaxID=44032 RepID=A0ABP5X0F0_9ACTN